MLPPSWISSNPIAILVGAAMTIVVSPSAHSRCLPSRVVVVDQDSSFDFEGPHEDNRPTGWKCSPPEAVSMDDLVVHGGSWAVRLALDAASSAEAVILSRAVPIDFTGTTVEIRGFLCTKDVKGFAGLWLRQDGRTGALEFDNMQRRKLEGTTEWTEYRVALPLNPKANRLLFGVLMAGKGTAWADDLQILVDGKPLSEAPKVERIATVFDNDREFLDGSPIQQTQFAKPEIENLFVLGKVWGFLKYHHPRIATGQVHWDYELFRIAPAVLAAADIKARDAALVAWIGKLGEITTCDPCAKPAENAHLLPGLAWIRDANLLGQELRDSLERIHRNRFAQGDQRFVSQPVGAGNVDFGEEDPYTNLSLPDTGYRVLALFRFWNIIEYWFPYRDVIGENWDDVLREFIPRMAAASQKDCYALQLMALIARVHDTHANLWSSLAVRPPRGPCALPISVRFAEDQPVITGYLTAAAAAKRDVLVGDVIIELDGVPVQKSIEDQAPFYAASNTPTRLRDQAHSLTLGACGETKVVVERDGARHELTMSRIPRTDLEPARWQTRHRPGPTLQRLSSEVAYLSLADIELKDVSAYIEAIQDARGLVIDIRNYPGQFVVFELGQHLVREPTDFATFTTADLSNPGAFVWGPKVSLQPVEPRFEGKIVILVDETSQSQAEYTAMAFRSAPGAIVIGSTTAGADGNVSRIPLPGGLHTMISGIGVFYPDKRVTQRVGIVPDIEVRSSISGIRDGRDEVLETALRHILGKEADEAGIREMARHEPTLTTPK